jgi:hypothetical protein
MKVSQTSTAWVGHAHVVIEVAGFNVAQLTAHRPQTKATSLQQ